MATVWPVSLPQKAFTGYRIGFENNVVRTKFLNGEIKSRPRHTNPAKKFITRMVIDGDQKDTFDAFFASIGHGADVFEWIDPDTKDADGGEVTVQMRFMKPDFEWIPVRHGPMKADMVYSAVLDLRIEGTV